MPAGLPLAILPLAIALLAEIPTLASADPAPAPAPAASAAPAYGPVQPAPPKPPEPRPALKTLDGPLKTATDGCPPARANAQPGEIIVCAPRPQGYRLNPDVLEANRAKRRGRPKRPERMNDTSCASTGPFGCTPGAGIDLIGGAMVAATMVARAIRGENVGEMFITDPQPTEYELYVEAKRQREAEEAEAAAKAKAKAAKAAGTPATPSEPVPKP